MARGVEHRLVGAQLVTVGVGNQRTRAVRKRCASPVPIMRHSYGYSPVPAERGAGKRVP